MQPNFYSQPDLDAIARNLSYLDLAHITPAESAAYEHELSVIASLNEALETASLAIRTPGSSPLWQRLQGCFIVQVEK